MRFSPMTGHHIGNRADSDKIAVSQKQPLDILSAFKRANKLEGDSHTGQRLVGIWAVLPLRINDGESGRQLLLAFMVIGYDDIEPDII